MRNDSRCLQSCAALWKSLVEQRLDSDQDENRGSDKGHEQQHQNRDRCLDQEQEKGGFFHNGVLRMQSSQTIARRELSADDQ